MSCRHDLALTRCKVCYPETGDIEPEGDGDSLDGPGAIDRDGNRLPLPAILKPRKLLLGESDPKGCLEAEARRNNCAHPPVAELHRILCFDCNTESTDDGRVIQSNSEPISFSLDELKGSEIDFERLAHLDAEHKKNSNN